MSANNRRKLLSVLCSSSSDEVKSHQGHMAAAVGLRLKTLCAFPLRRYFHPEAWCVERILGVTMVTVGHNGHCGSRNGGCELFFGDGAVEDTLDGGPGVPDGKWRVVGTSQEEANELLGMWAKPTCGLKDARNEVDVWISVEFVLFRSLGHGPGFVQRPRTDCKRKERQRTHPNTRVNR